MKQAGNVSANVRSLSYKINTKQNFNIRSKQCENKQTENVLNSWRHASVHYDDDVTHFFSKLQHEAVLVIKQTRNRQVDTFNMFLRWKTQFDIMVAQ